MTRQNSRIRVVLADDHRMVREALGRILDASGKINVVDHTSDGPTTLEAVRRSQPEVVVLDYSMPGQDAPALIDRLLQSSPASKILVLTVHKNYHYAIRVLESGAHGYLVKSAAVEELVDAIEKVQQGEIFLSAQISGDVLQHLRRPKRERVGLDALSQREFDLLRLLGQGMSLQQCAGQMKVSTSTASTYRARILEKLSLSTTAELIRFAVDNEIVG